MKKRTLFVMILGFSFASPVLAATVPQTLTVGENVVSQTTGIAIACPLQQELRKQQLLDDMEKQPVKQEKGSSAGQAS